MQTVKLYTIEDLEGMDGDFELDRGVLVPLNPPKRRHALTVSRVTNRLSDFVNANDLGEVYGETGYALERQPDTLRGPDVSFVRKERLDPNDLDNYPEGAADLVVEVFSPGDRRGEIDRKVGQYLGAGARLVWVMYPKKKQVIVHDGDEPQILRDGDILTGGDVLPGFEWPVSEIFP